MKQPPRKPKPPLDMLQGEQFFEKLTNGYKIIKYRWDGWNWHFLLEQTDKTKLPGVDMENYKRLYFSSLFPDTKKEKRSASLSLMISFQNMQRRVVLRRFNDEVVQDILHKERLIKLKR